MSHLDQRETMYFIEVFIFIYLFFVKWAFRLKGYVRRVRNGQGHMKSAAHRGKRAYQQIQGWEQDTPTTGCALTNLCRPTFQNYKVATPNFSREHFVTQWISQQCKPTHTHLCGSAQNNGFHNGVPLLWMAKMESHALFTCETPICDKVPPRTIIISFSLKKLVSW